MAPGSIADEVAPVQLGTADMQQDLASSSLAACCLPAEVSSLYYEIVLGMLQSSVLMP